MNCAVLAAYRILHGSEVSINKRPFSNANPVRRSHYAFLPFCLRADIGILFYQRLWSLKDGTVKYTTAVADKTDKRDFHDANTDTDTDILARILADTSDA